MAVGTDNCMIALLESDGDECLDDGMDVEEQETEELAQDGTRGTDHRRTIVARTHALPFSELVQEEYHLGQNNYRKSGSGENVFRITKNSNIRNLWRVFYFFESFKAVSELVQNLRGRKRHR